MFKTITRPFKQGDRVKSIVGWGTIVGEYNNDPSRFNHWQVLLEKSGEAEDFHKWNLRHETFWEYCTHPAGFGKHGKVWPIFFLLVIVGLVVAGISTWNDKGWTAIVAAGVITSVLVGMTYRNYNGKTV